MNTDAIHNLLRRGEREGMRYALTIPQQSGTSGGGARQGKRPGYSVDFHDYRDYQPGDDPRWIDWSAYARSDRLMIKLFHEEVSPHLDLVVDGSRSMALANSAKKSCTLGLAALLATAARNAHCTQRVFFAGNEVRELVDSHQSPANWQDEALRLSGTRPLPEAFAQGPPRLRPQSIRILVSDLLWPGDPRQVLTPMAHGGADLAVIQLAAATDIIPPERGNLRLHDVETNEDKEIFIDAAMEKQFHDAVARHRQMWEETCRELGARLVVLVAEQVIQDEDTWNLDPLKQHGILEVG